MAAEGRLDATREALRSPFPWIAFTAALALTAAAWFALERGRHEDARGQFDRRVENLGSALRARLLLYEQVLRSGAAHVAAAQRVGHEDWRRYIGLQQLHERFPGVQSVGYAEVQASGKVVALYQEPSRATDVTPPGRDLLEDPALQPALERAFETGEAAVSARVWLPGDAFLGDRSGFVIFAPVFDDRPVAAAKDGRRAGIRGFVYAPIRVGDMAHALLEQGMLRYVDLRIYDEPQGGEPQQELVDTRSAWRATPGAAAPIFERVLHFPVPARSWTVRVVSRPDFDAVLREQRPWVVAAGGLITAVVMFLLTTALVEAWNRAREMSLRDPLTGLYNRRYHDETMPRELARARRTGHPLGVIAIDIDHFKRLNDGFGHEAGDFVLAQTGELLRTATRSGDIPCRFGGEEFTVILPGATLEASRQRAEAIRASFAALRFVHEGREIGPFTLSAGVAAVPPTAQDWTVAMRLADRALYAAKQAGRNRVLTADEA